MKKIVLPVLALLLLHGCAQMPDYSNVEGDKPVDESRYTVLETETWASREQRGFLDDRPELNLIRINDKKVGNIPFSTYYYKNDSPQRAVLQPGTYTIQLEYRLPLHFMFTDLKFNAKAGQKVIARSKYVGVSRLEIWLEDAATGEVVSTRMH
ncbi:hypothetical protein NJC40_15825 [Pseudomonas sp. 21LCFQ02]|uniref:hypothetical protein n=1 Tax=Pseudomonas sp. 21LCFQ02 TaxID=2957505 RepID=UPI00209B68FF|nr:hypothetical protein [Pseudomonas sp. 21LCFQ02]MCO8169241.1 hypothetical protein [Pseudomonas sp. 21LCFQ02]